jgi:hypothetical protein
MVRKKRTRPTTTTAIIDGSAVTLTIEENPAFEGLCSNLAEIGKTPGVKGYILRNAAMAVIDLPNPAKLIEYALLSSQATDACQEISELFSLNTTKTLVEGTKIKMLCMVIGENKLSVFMEKTVDHTDILRRISP